MKPYYEDPWLTVYGGDCRAVMAEMEPESVHCVVTSPPYWGLRDYGTADQLGLEPTPEEYVANMVAVFREVRRVLRNDGTVWLNLGDSYAGVGGGASAWSTPLEQKKKRASNADIPARTLAGLKPKDLVGIPWRVAFALQADGWYLRSDIIWSKPNPMPESVTDRPTKSHEYLFLLSKAPRYYFDHEAVREDARTAEWPGIGPKHGTTDNHKSDYDAMAVNSGRNLRSVWTIATQPYPGAHFATFPRKLVEPCVKAGTSERGVCPECGAPWVRQVLKATNPSKWAAGEDLSGGAFDDRTSNPQSSKSMHRNGSNVAGPPAVTTGWRSSCAHTDDPIPATVLDPFAGSGTTGAVAQALGRRAVLIDLNPDYLAQAMGRNRDIPLGLAG